MGIYLPNMEMLKDGRRHKALLIFEPDGTGKCIVEYSESYSDRHIKTFEAIEIHTPHGRLIDADELIKFFPDKGEGSWTYNIVVSGIIRDAPTVIPEEE